MRKINIILPGLGDSGGMKVIRRYRDMLNENGWDVVIYCSIKGYNLHRYSSRLKNTIHQIYCALKVIPEVVKKKDVIWVPYISNHTVRDADFILATMWATAYEVEKLDIKKGKKYYFIQDFEVWDNREWGLKSYQLPLGKMVISTWINDQLMKELGLGPFPVVMNGMDTSTFYDRHIRNDENKIFLMLNHILEKKGVLYGIKVFEKIKEKHPDAKLRMFGMCDNSNLPDFVEYYQNPNIGVLTNLYSTSNYFIFPSLEEGWGLTPLEAMACGCIVFGTNTGFVLDVGKHKFNMMISEPGNVDEMVENVLKVIDDATLKKKITVQAKKTVEKLSWSNSVNLLIKYLNAVAGMEGKSDVL